MRHTRPGSCRAGIDAAARLVASARRLRPPGPRSRTRSRGRRQVASREGRRATVRIAEARARKGRAVSNSLCSIRTSPRAPTRRAGLDCELTTFDSVSTRLCRRIEWPHDAPDAITLRGAHWQGDVACSASGADGGTRGRGSRAIPRNGARGVARHGGAVNVRCR